MPLELLALLKGKIVQAGVIDVASDAVETPEEVAPLVGDVTKSCRKNDWCDDQLRHGADASRHRRSQAVALGEGAELARKRFG